MPSLSDMNWSALIAHPLDDPGPWIALAVAIGVVLIGYVEMRMHRNIKIGLSTWGVAIAPFLVAVYWIGTWNVLSVFERGSLVTALVALSWALLRFLYLHAKGVAERKDKVPGSN